jgi:hypothetical protein
MHFTNHAFGVSSVCPCVSSCVWDSRALRSYWQHFDSLFLLDNLALALARATDPNGEQPLASPQLYFYDPQVALVHRCRQNSGPDPETICTFLQTMLLEYHQYVPVYRHAYEILEHCDPIDNISIHFFCWTISHWHGQPWRTRMESNHWHLLLRSATPYLDFFSTKKRMHRNSPLEKTKF